MARQNPIIPCLVGGLIACVLAFFLLGLSHSSQPMFLPRPKPTHEKLAVWLTIPRPGGGIAASYHDARNITIEEDPSGDPSRQVVTFSTDRGVLMHYEGPAPFISSWRLKASEMGGNQHNTLE